MMRQATPDPLINLIPSEEPGQQPNALVKLSAATRALAEARNVDEVKQIMDLAEAARIYAKRANLGLEAQNYAAEIHLDGARKAGELLAQLERGDAGGNGSNQWQRSNSSNAGRIAPSEYRAVLDETGTTRQDANRWQQIASLPQEKTTRRSRKGRFARKAISTTVASFPFARSVMPTKNASRRNCAKKPRPRLRS